MSITVTKSEYQIVQTNIAAFLEKEYGIINQSPNKLKHLAAMALDYPSHQSLEKRFISLMTIDVQHDFSSLPEEGLAIPKPDFTMWPMHSGLESKSKLMDLVYYIQIWDELDESEGYVWFCVDYAQRHGKGGSDWPAFSSCALKNDKIDYHVFDAKGKPTILPPSLFSIPDLNVKKMDAYALPFSPYKEPMECDNCEYTGDRKDLPVAKKLSERIEPGGVYTDVECPCCGSLCFPATKTLEVAYEKAVKLIFKAAGDAKIYMDALKDIQLAANLEIWDVIMTNEVAEIVHQHGLREGERNSMEYGGATMAFSRELAERIRQKADWYIQYSNSQD